MCFPTLRSPFRGDLNYGRRGGRPPAIPEIVFLTSSKCLRMRPWMSRKRRTGLPVWKYPAIRLAGSQALARCLASLSSWQAFWGR